MEEERLYALAMEKAEGQAEEARLAFRQRKKQELLAVSPWGFLCWALVCIGPLGP